MKNNIKFEDRLRQLLFDKGWSQSELARRIGVSPQAVQQWMNGVSKPRSKSLESLSEVAGVPVAWFYGEVAQTEIQPGSALDEREQQLLQLFRQLTDKKKASTLALVKEFVEEQDQLLSELLNLKNQ